MVWRQASEILEPERHRKPNYSEYYPLFASELRHKLASSTAKMLDLICAEQFAHSGVGLEDVPSVVGYL